MLVFAVLLIVSAAVAPPRLASLSKEFLDTDFSMTRWLDEKDLTEGYQAVSEGSETVIDLSNGPSLTARLHEPTNVGHIFALDLCASVSTIRGHSAAFAHRYHRPKYIPSLIFFDHRWYTSEKVQVDLLRPSRIALSRHSRLVNKVGRIVLGNNQLILGARRGENYCGSEDSVSYALEENNVDWTFSVDVSVGDSVISDSRVVFASVGSKLVLSRALYQEFKTESLARGFYAGGNDRIHSPVAENCNELFPSIRVGAFEIPGSWLPIRNCAIHLGVGDALVLGPWFLSHTLVDFNHTYNTVRWCRGNI